MFRLTREVRVAIAEDEPPANARNGYAGFPPLSGLIPFVTVQVTLGGKPDDRSGYLVNIKRIDEVVRRDGLPILRDFALRRRGNIADLGRRLFECLRETWPAIEQCEIHFSPFTALSVA